MGKTDRQLDTHRLPNDAANKRRQLQWYHPWLHGHHGLWALIFLFFLALFLPNAFPYWFRGAAARGFLAAIAMFFNALSPLAIPFLMTFFPFYAAGRRIPVYTEFIEGAKEGFRSRYESSPISLECWWPSRYFAIPAP